jgi:aspartyl-tRNA synthetase
LTHLYRTHRCADLRASDADKGVKLSGWLHNRRHLGGILFIDLRDHYGITQLVVRPGASAFETLERLPKETVIKVDGRVALRGEENVNPDLPTGEVEVEVDQVEVIGACESLPFSINPEDPVSEELRLKYRFLDLRRSRMHRNVILRSDVIRSIRERMRALGFREYQTPILTSSSPEGARDYLVPSRIYPGKFFALPQAPQQFKQLLMVAGFDRYFQIAPCFRDEDSRADRSPGEFYQLDLEMSFVEQEDVFHVVEEVFGGLFKEFAPDTTVTVPFPRISYREALIRYGTDKPDLRVPFLLHDVSGVFKSSGFRAFAGRHVRALSVPGCQDQPRSFFDRMERFAVEQGAKGLAWLKVGEKGSVSGTIAKALSDAEIAQILSAVDAGPGSAIFFCATGDADEAGSIMSQVRLEAGRMTGRVEENVFRFCWIVDFPMYERGEDGTIQFSHNPFSMPQRGLDALNRLDPLDILAWQYDIVCNGIELSSGAIRNHQPDIMYRAFEIAGYSRQDVEEKFGGMLRALRLGAPPHGGIAPGVDRIVMLLCGEPNIRETIAFPLNQNAQDLMMNAPSEVSEKQLADVHIRLREPATRPG